MSFALIFRTKLLKKIYDEYDLNVRMHEKPVGFTLKNKNNESNYTYRSKSVIGTVHFIMFSRRRNT